MKRKAKNSMSRLISLLFLILCLGLAACGTSPATSTTDSSTASASSETVAPSTSAEPEASTPEAKKEPVTIKLWAVAIQGPDESKKPQEEWLFVKMLREYEKLTGNVTIEFSVIPDQTAVHQTIKASAMAKNGPDIVNLWAGTYVSSLNEVLLPLNDLMPPSDLQSILGWNMLTDNLKPPADGGKILGYPCGGLEVGILEYNNDIIKKSGLDFENNPPKTVDDFMTACEKIKQAGYQPVVSSDGGYNGAVSFTFNKWWSQQEGLQRLSSNGQQITKFADDIGFLNLFTTLQTLIKKGYLNEDYTTKADPGFDFYNGKAAMYPTGNWDIEGAKGYLGDNLRILRLPDFSADVKQPGFEAGGLGQSLCVLNYTSYPQECVDLLSWLNNRENSIRLGKHISKFPARNDLSLTDFGWENDPVYKSVFELGQKAETWHEFAMDPVLVNEYYALGASCMTGKMTPAEFAEAMDAKAQELLGE